MLQLWGRSNSTNVQKVMLALDELGLAYQRHEAGMAFGVVGTPAYLAMNPTGLVPTLQDDDFVLWESNAIVRYLAAQYGQGTLQPASIRAQADADRWMDWQQTSFAAPLTVLFLGTVRAPGTQTQEAMAQALVKGTACLAMLDDVLAKHDFVGGAHLGAVDCVLAPCVHRWLNLPHADLQANRAKMPHVEAYYARLMARPAMQKTLTLPLA